MFEEETKKHKEHFVSVALNLGLNLSTAETIGTQKEESFREGAEFGYNNANEWHFIDKEGLPEDKYKMLVQYVNGDYDIAFNFAGTWRGTSGNELRGVYAWKEIVPPSEPMRSLDKEEQKNYTEAINKVYKPTGVKLFDKEIG